MENKFHCIECAGHATARGEKCFSCDGKGNELVQKVDIVTKTQKKSK